MVLRAPRSSAPRLRIRVRLGRDGLRDPPAQHDPRVGAQIGQRGIQCRAANIVEIDIDAIRTRAPDRRRSGRSRPCSRSRLRSPSSRSEIGISRPRRLSRPHGRRRSADLRGDLADTAGRADTSTVSPGFNAPTSRTPEIRRQRARCRADPSSPPRTQRQIELLGLGARSRVGCDCQSAAPLHQVADGERPPPGFATHARCRRRASRCRSPHRTRIARPVADPRPHRGIDRDIHCLDQHFIRVRAADRHAVRGRNARARECRWAGPSV